MRKTKIEKKIERGKERGKNDESLRNGVEIVQKN